MTLFALFYSCIPPKLDSNFTDFLLGYVAGGGLLPTFVLSESITSIEEGTTQVVKFHLSKQIDSDSTVYVQADYKVLGVKYKDQYTWDYTYLTFTPEDYDKDQDFTVVGMIDNDDKNHTGTITISAFGFQTSVLSIQKESSQGKWVSLFLDSDSIDALGTNHVLVNLSVAPSEDVEVKLATNITSGITLNESLVFTRENYSTSQVGADLSRDILTDKNFIINNSGNIRIDVTAHGVSFTENLFLYMTSYGLLDTTGNDVPYVFSTNTIKDDKNKLYWFSCTFDDLDGRPCTQAKPLDWVTAVKYCNIIGANWRLPTESELNTLYNFKTNQVNQKFDSDPTASNSFVDNGFYWTILNDKDYSDLVWVIQFEPNYTNLTVSKTSKGYVRCVSPY